MSRSLLFVTNKFLLAKLFGPLIPWHSLGGGPTWFIRPGDSLLLWILTCSDIWNEMLPYTKQVLLVTRNPIVGKFGYVRQMGFQHGGRQLVSGPLMRKSRLWQDNTKTLRTRGTTYGAGLFSISLLLNQSQQDAILAVSLRPVIVLFLCVPSAPAVSLHRTRTWRPDILRSPLRHSHHSVSVVPRISDQRTLCLPWSCADLQTMQHY